MCVCVWLQAPKDKTQLDAWLDHLAKPEFNGCGHIRLMITPSDVPQYSVAAGDGAVANCVGVADANCIKSDWVASQMIKNFFK